MSSLVKYIKTYPVWRLQTPKQGFWWLCVLHSFLWTLVPAIAQKNGALDVLEAIAWGAQWQLGYDRDPFLVAWLAQIASWFSGPSLWSIYALSQICIITCFVTVWRFARTLGLSPLHALMAVGFLEGIFYYHFTTPEFNDNVLQIPLWTLTAFYFYRALSTQKNMQWLLTGVFAAFALLAKYFSVMLLLPMLGLLLATPVGRNSFRHPGIYIGAIGALVVFMPNIIWQFQHDWQYIHYALNRAQVAPSIWNHLRYPLKFFISQVIAISPALALYFLAARPRFDVNSGSAFDRSFLLFMVAGPLLITVIYSAFTGTQIRSMWGTPLFSLLGIALVYFSRPQIEVARRYFISYGTYFVLALISYIMMVTVSPYILGYAKNEFYPSQQVAHEALTLWKQHYKQPMPFVLGSRRMTARVSVYTPDHPIPYFDLNPLVNPWIDEEEVRSQGGVVLWDARKLGFEVPKTIRKRFPQVHKANIKTISWQSAAKNISPVIIGMAILPPKG